MRVLKKGRKYATIRVDIDELATVEIAIRGHERLKKLMADVHKKYEDTIEVSYQDEYGTWHTSHRHKVTGKLVY